MEALICADCGNPLPPGHAGACPACGSTKKQLDVVRGTETGASDQASVYVMRRQWRSGRLSLLGLAMLALGAVALGFFLVIGIGVILGVALGVAGALILLRVFAKVMAGIRGGQRR